jgi:hypothetical protein
LKTRAVYSNVDQIQSTAVSVYYNLIPGNTAELHHPQNWPTKKLVIHLTNPDLASDKVSETLIIIDPPTKDNDVSFSLPVSWHGVSLILQYRYL